MANIKYEDDCGGMKPIPPIKGIKTKPKKTKTTTTKKKVKRK